jgi:hypothetical protein
MQEGGFSLKFKRKEREASAEVKNGVAIPPLPHTPSWSRDILIEHMDRFNSAL